MDQLKKDGHDKAWSSLLKNLNLKKNNITEISNFVMAGIENQKNYGVCTSDGKKIIADNLISKSYEKKFAMKLHLNFNMKGLFACLRATAEI